MSINISDTDKNKKTDLFMSKVAVACTFFFHIFTNKNNVMENIRRLFNDWFRQTTNNGKQTEINKRVGCFLREIFKRNNRERWLWSTKSIPREWTEKKEMILISNLNLFTFSYRLLATRVSYNSRYLFYWVSMRECSRLHWSNFIFQWQSKEQINSWYSNWCSYRWWRLYPWNLKYSRDRQCRHTR